MNPTPVGEGYPSGHSALIHDLCLNHSGTRLASCSTDRKILIWNLTPSAGQYKFTQSGVIPNAHTASITKLTWAHSTYGQVLASCGLDNHIIIWQEVPATDAGKKNDERSWKVLWETIAPNGNVTDVKFAPRQFGLKLAVASNDGVQTLVSESNFSQWNPGGRFEPTKRQTGGVPQRVGVTSISWNPSALEEREMMVIGTDTGDVAVWACDGSSVRDKWYLLTLNKDPNAEATIAAANKGVDLASSGGNPPPASSASGAIYHQLAVTDVAWAPSIGRRYHLIASCSKDGVLMIHKLYPAGADRASKTQKEFNAVLVFYGAGVHNFNRIWRVSWNLTGTTLASSGDDGFIMLWQQSLTEVSETSGELVWKRIQCLLQKAPAPGAAEVPP